jgi:prevent-host-death family protein
VLRDYIGRKLEVPGTGLSGWRPCIPLQPLSKVVQFVVQSKRKSMMAKVHRRIGKAQARDEFPALVESVSKGGGVIEITDYGKVAAVLLSEKEFQWLWDCAQKVAQPKRDPRGILILADNQALEDAHKDVLSDFEKSLGKSTKKL